MVRINLSEVVKHVTEIRLNDTAVIEPYIFTTETYREIVNQFQAELFGDGSSEHVLFRGLLSHPIEDIRDALDVVDSSIFQSIGTIDSDVLHPQTVIIRSAIKEIQGRLDLLEMSLAAKEAGQPINIVLIQPMHEESRRISPRTGGNPFGENALNYKLDQLEEMSDAAHYMGAEINFKVLVIDDTNQSSGKTAEEIINQRPTKHSNVSAEVEYLCHRKGYKYAAESKKGGSVKLAIELLKDDPKHKIDTPENYVIVDMDADTSIATIAVASAVLPIVRGETLFTAGNRRMHKAVSSSSNRRNERSKLFRHMVQLMVPAVFAMDLDPNRALKAMHSQLAFELVDQMEEVTFPYQIELIALASKLTEIKNIPVAFLDSESLSTQNGFSGGEMAETYSEQLRRTLSIARKMKLRGSIELGIIESIIDSIANGTDQKMWDILENVSVDNIFAMTTSVMKDSTYGDTTFMVLLNLLNSAFSDYAKKSGI